MRKAIGTVDLGPGFAMVPVFNPGYQSRTKALLRSNPEVVLDKRIRLRTVAVQRTAVRVNPGGFLRLVLTMTTVAGKRTFTSREMTFEEARAAYLRDQHLKA